MEKEINLDNLIKALQIVRKYGNITYPTHCEHDTLYICINTENISDEDLKELDELGFYKNTEWDGLYSFAYGSA